jgi:hypothetical protein
MLAMKIIGGIGNKLEDIHDDTLITDLPVRRTIAARFDITPGIIANVEFVQYGAYGIPYFRMDVSKLSGLRREGRLPELNTAKKDAVKRSYTFLLKAFGIYFIGSGHQVTERITAFLNSPIN